MTDREMLELAAKAGGYALDGHTQKSWAYTLGGVEWNPLVDDGDALRLAVKLGIGAQSFSSLGHSHAGAEQITRSIVIKEHHGCDPYAATRRAIVRAAAEIGRQMEETK